MGAGFGEGRDETLGVVKGGFSWEGRDSKPLSPLLNKKEKEFFFFKSWELFRGGFIWEGRE